MSCRECTLPVSLHCPGNFSQKISVCNTWQGVIVIVANFDPFLLATKNNYFQDPASLPDFLGNNCSILTVCRIARLIFSILSISEKHFVLVKFWKYKFHHFLPLVVLKHHKSCTLQIKKRGKKRRKRNTKKMLEILA